MTIMPPAVLLVLYQLAAAEQGVSSSQITARSRTTSSRSTSPGVLHLPAAAIAAPGARHLRLLPPEIPRWNTISISGYHMAEAGHARAGDRFTLANPRNTSAAIASGLAVDEFAPRLSFFFVAGPRCWRSAKFGRPGGCGRASCVRSSAGRSRSQMLRFHTQTRGSADAQQPEVNLARSPCRRWPRAGRHQSLHTNSFDEAIALPSEKAARLACGPSRFSRSKPTDRDVDPLPVLRDRVDDTDIEEQAIELMAKVADLGGAVAPSSRASRRRRLSRSAYRIAQQIDSGERKW